MKIQFTKDSVLKRKFFFINSVITVEVENLSCSVLNVNFYIFFLGKIAMYYREKRRNLSHVNRDQNENVSIRRTIITIIRTVVIHYDHGYPVYYNYIVSHYFIEVRLASLVDTDTPRNHADEEERVKANAFLSLGFVTASVYTGKEQSLLSTTREIGSSVQSETRARVRVRIINPRTHAHACTMYMRGGPLSGGNYGNANWPV